MVDGENRACKTRHEMTCSLLVTSNNFGLYEKKIWVSNCHNCQTPSRETGTCASLLCAHSASEKTSMMAYMLRNWTLAQLATSTKGFRSVAFCTKAITPTFIHFCAKFKHGTWPSYAFTFDFRQNARQYYIWTCTGKHKTLPHLDRRNASTRR